MEIWRAEFFKDPADLTPCRIWRFEAGSKGAAADMAQREMRNCKRVDVMRVETRLQITTGTELAARTASSAPA